MSRSFTVGMIGLGKLGLPVAEKMAESGLHTVYGTDVYSDRATDCKNVRFTDMETLVHNSQIVFIAVPTPHDPAYDGSKTSIYLEPKDFDYTDVLTVLNDIQKARASSPNDTLLQTIVIISTCLPGTTESLFNPIMPQSKLIYNPYFIAMGTVQEDFVNPEFMLLGVSPELFHSGTPDVAEHETADLDEFYETLMPGYKKFVMTWNEAECTKVFYNTFISFKLSYVNMIQDVAERIGHMNVDAVTNALCNADQRLISTRYMKAGMGDGGPCHPRDNIALKRLSQKLNLGYDLFGEIMQSRDRQAANLAEFLMNQTNREIVILGKAFKPGVPLVDGSYSLLVGSFISKYFSVTYVDKMIPGMSEIRQVGLMSDGKVNIERSPRTYLIGHDDDHWFNYPFIPGSTVVDPWRRMEKKPGLKVIHYGNTRNR